jgi:hypothetical protein
MKLPLVVMAVAELLVALVLYQGSSGGQLRPTALALKPPLLVLDTLERARMLILY